MTRCEWCDAPHQDCECEPLDHHLSKSWKQARPVSLFDEVEALEAEEEDEDGND